MKHPSSRELFGYWDTTRDGAPAPDRSAFEPGAVRGLLGDVFVLGCDPGFPFRVAGTRICALIGRDLKSESFTALFHRDSRRECELILSIAADETLAIIAGVTTTGGGLPAQLELLLLPFAPRAHAPLSLTGLLAPFGDRPLGPLGPLRLSSWRTIGQQPRRLSPRALRKWEVVRGLTVYEGLR